MDNPTIHEIMMVTTIQGNYEGFTKKQVQKAVEARRLKVIIGSTSKSDFEELVHHKMIKNFPVMTDDIICTDEIPRLCVANLRG